MKARLELVDRCSTLLWTAERERAPIAVLTNEIPALDQATAYAIQWATFGRRGAPLAGFKLGGTVRPAPGIDRRSYGCLAASGRSGEGGALADPAPFMKPVIEAEIALRLGRDLAGAGHTRESVAAHLDAVIPALEIADTRYTAFPSNLIDNIADNSSGGGFVLGEPVAWTSGTDLRQVEVLFHEGDSLLGRGRGDDVMGDPLLALAWLAGRLAEDGRVLPAGAVVLTGGLVSSMAGIAGRSFRAVYTGFGELSVAFAPMP